MFMQMYVGVTDKDWFEQLRSVQADEVNFWKPGQTVFKAIQENELFLFKLHSPYNYIVGGGFFVRYSYLPSFLAWQAFGTKNGVSSLDELNQRIQKYQKRNQIDFNPEIGCIILTDCFWWDEKDWIAVPKDWKPNIVSGKTYGDTEDGKKLFDAVQERIASHSAPLNSSTEIISFEESSDRYSSYMTKHRLGQGAFRIAVTEAYQRRCAITGEKTLPVLEAAHIKAYSEEGPNTVQNGLLLKSDFHTLYDSGYLTITPDYHIEVSQRLHLDYGNGKDYYKYQGEKVLILPKSSFQQPSREYLEWHNEKVYLG